MSKYRTIKIKNGSHFEDYYIYSCHVCGEDVECAHPLVQVRDDVYCCDCALIQGIITPVRYSELRLYFLPDDTRAEVYGGKVHVIVGGGKFPWEETNRDIRRSKEYRAWRETVLERDKHTCQICKAPHKKLCVHHIKSFAQNSELRLEVSNGVTLCESCHKLMHKKRR